MNSTTAATDGRRSTKTRNTTDAEGPHDVPQVRNIALEKACNRGMTFNTQGHYSY